MRAHRAFVLSGQKIRPDPMAGKHHQTYLLPYISNAVTIRRTIMAKGQQRKTKEAKKPKKQPPPATLSGKP